MWLGAPPATSPVDDDVLAAAARGVVAVRARGCGPVSNGTAFAVAPGVLVGAAHVIAGASAIEIEWSPSGAVDPSTYPAVVVGYEEGRDLALLLVDAAVPPLGIDQARLGASGVVLGYPEGGGLVVSPARIEHYVSATGLWGDGTARSVYVVAADIRTGQSGAPLVDQGGNVVGVAFGTVRGPSEIGFALSRAELLGFLVSAGVDARVDTLGRTVIRARPGDLSVTPNGECSS
ncbi:S1 family peptidase [Candidatus Poriferisodalis sp.]|uniref:S1 family peptidase n=1 Tax=Candidatus Poriferisodalis sp. TaxID=3101277 RepID=UPI003B51F548